MAMEPVAVVLLEEVKGMDGLDVQLGVVGKLGLEATARPEDLRRGIDGGNALLAQDRVKEPEEILAVGQDVAGSPLGAHADCDTAAGNVLLLALVEAGIQGDHDLRWQGSAWRAVERRPTPVGMLELDRPPLLELSGRSQANAGGLHGAKILRSRHPPPTEESHAGLEPLPSSIPPAHALPPSKARKHSEPPGKGGLRRASASGSAGAPRRATRGASPSNRRWSWS